MDKFIAEGIEEGAQDFGKEVEVEKTIVEEECMVIPPLH